MKKILVFGSTLLFTIGSYAGPNYDQALEIFNSGRAISANPKDIVGTYEGKCFDKNHDTTGGTRMFFGYFETEQSGVRYFGFNTGSIPFDEWFLWDATQQVIYGQFHKTHQEWSEAKLTFPLSNVPRFYLLKNTGVEISPETYRTSLQVPLKYGYSINRYETDYRVLENGDLITKASYTQSNKFGDSESDEMVCSWYRQKIGKKHIPTYYQGPTQNIQCRAIPTPTRLVQATFAISEDGSQLEALFSGDDMSPFTSILRRTQCEKSQKGFRCESPYDKEKHIELILNSDMSKMSIIGDAYKIPQGTEFPCTKVDRATVVDVVHKFKTNDSFGYQKLDEM